MLSVRSIPNTEIGPGAVKQIGQVGQQLSAAQHAAGVLPAAPPGRLCVRGDDVLHRSAETPAQIAATCDASKREPPGRGLLCICSAALSLGAGARIPLPSGRAELARAASRQVAPRHAQPKS